MAQEASPHSTRTPELAPAAGATPAPDPAHSAHPARTAEPSQNARAFDAFVFDCDGTILDTLPDLVVVTNAALRECGYPERTRDEIKSFVGNGVKALMYQAVPDGTPQAEADAALACWKRLHPELEGRLTKAYPGIPEMLAELRRRGAKTAVLSNKFDEGLQEVIAGFLPGYFDAAHGECEQIPRKPDPTGLLFTLSELGVAPERAVYVGDSPGDIATARNAGTFAVAVSWGYHTREDMEQADPDLIVDAAEDLLALRP